MMAVVVGKTLPDQRHVTWVMYDESVLARTTVQPFMLSLRDKYEYHRDLSEWLLKRS